MSEITIGGFLEKMGLTEYESKTLSTLFKLGESEAPEISRTAQVPKTRVYDVLDKLVRRGLVIEIKSRPKKYRVIDSSVAIDRLIAEKKDDINKIESCASDLKSTIASMGKTSEEVGEKIMKVKDKFDFERILSQELAKTKNSIVGFAEIGTEQAILREAIEKAKSKNINVKLINSMLNYPTSTYAKGKGDVKHFKHGLNAFILDNKKVIMALSDLKKDSPEYHFVIWNNNKAIVNTLSHYFQKCWLQGKNL